VNIAGGGGDRHSHQRAYDAADTDPGRAVAVY
jgi:hypothetical protein